jgi:hypothetical protein
MLPSRVGLCPSWDCFPTSDFHNGIRPFGDRSQVHVTGGNPSRKASRWRTSFPFFNPFYLIRKPISRNTAVMTSQQNFNREFRCLDAAIYIKQVYGTISGGLSPLDRECRSNLSAPVCLSSYTNRGVALQIIRTIWWGLSDWLEPQEEADMSSRTVKSAVRSSCRSKPCSKNPVPARSRRILRTPAHCFYWMTSLSCHS